MAVHGEVVWAPDPFTSGGENPRPWLVVAADRLPYSGEEFIAVAFTTQSHHPGSFAVPSEAWMRGEPDTQSHVLPWSVATLKDDIHVAGVQGAVTDEFAERVTTALISYLDPAAADQSYPTERMQLLGFNPLTHDKGTSDNGSRLDTK